MKILLVQPPCHDPAFAFAYATEPLGLETIGAALRGHDVSLVDLRFSTEPLRATLQRLRPDVVATGGYTANVYDVIGIARAARRYDPRLRTVVGGHHATIQAEDFAIPEVDAIVLGPGERTFPELVDAWERGGDVAEVAGLALPQGNSLARTPARPLPPDLNDSPLPDRELAAAYRRHYRAFGQAVGLVNTSRGCPYRCTFCSIVNEMGGRYLTKQPEQVLADIARVPQRLVRFADGNTFGSPRRAKRLADALREARTGKRFMVDARADTAVRHPTLFEAWREAGLELVAVGFESATDEGLASFGKGSTVRENVEAIAVLQGAGLKVIGQFIVDPGFDEADFDALADFVVRHGIHYPSFSIATPFPGTALLEERAGQVVSRDYRRYDCMHSVLFPRLGWDEFYRRYIGLYERCYGPERVLAAARQWLDPKKRAGAASPLLLAAVAVQVRFSRRSLMRAYGVR